MNQQTFINTAESGQPAVIDSDVPFAEQAAGLRGFFKRILSWFGIESGEMTQKEARNLMPGKAEDGTLRELAGEIRDLLTPAPVIRAVQEHEISHEEAAWLIRESMEGSRRSSQNNTPPLRFRPLQIAQQEPVEFPRGMRGNNNAVAKNPEPPTVIYLSGPEPEAVAAAPTEAPSPKNSEPQEPKDEPKETLPNVIVNGTHIVPEKKAKGFFKGAFLAAAAQGAAKYGLREGMTQLGWLGGPGGVFATAAGSSAVVTGFAIHADYREAKKKALEEMRKNGADGVWNNQSRREALRTIFDKEGRRKYLVTATKSFLGGLLGGCAVVGLAELVESPETFSYLKDKFNGVKDAVVAKYEAFRGSVAASAPAHPATAQTAQPEQIAKGQAAKHLAVRPLSAAGGEDSAITTPDIFEGKEPLIMPVLDDFEAFAGKDGLELSTIEKVREAEHGDPKAIWKLADNFANGTGGVAQDNSMAKIFCGEADRLLEKDAICPEGDLTQDHTVLFEEQLEQWDKETAARDERLAELDGKIEEIRKENDGHAAEAKSHLGKMDEIIAEGKALHDEIHVSDGGFTEPPESCTTTQNEDGMFTQVCENSNRQIGDEYVVELK